jgi:hypothetical protein
MGFADKTAERVGRNWEKAVRKTLRDALEPGEEIEAWFAGVTPGTTSDMVRQAASSAGAISGPRGLTEMAVRRMLPADTAPTFTPYRGAWVLTNRRIHRVALKLSAPRPKRALDTISFTDVLAVRRDEELSKAAASKVGRGYAVLATGETLEFELMHFSVSAFDRFCERFRAHRGPVAEAEPEPA